VTDAKNYVIKNWITTVVGVVLVLAGLVLLVIDKLDGGDFAIVSGVGAGLMGAKDGLVKRILNIKQKQ